MAIIQNVLREKVRRKELYIVSVIGLLILLLFTSGSGSISVGGETITDYNVLAPILITIINVLSGVLAILLSYRTIPDEYERKTSHLIWVRGISQKEYHSKLAIANMISSYVSAGILYVGLLVFSLLKGHGEIAARMVPSFLVLLISISVISIFTSAISIVLPPVVTGLISGVLFFIGILHGILELLATTVSGFTASVLKVLLFIVPDLNRMQKQAGNLLNGNDVDVHIILVVLLTIYVISILFFVLRKKEA